MKRSFSLIALFSLFFVAGTASAQVISPIPPTAVAPPQTIELLPAATTTVASSSTDKTSFKETIEIIPGSVSLTLTSMQPAVTSASDSLTPAVAVEKTDGLFDLIYTGFEEFVFRVFGI